MKRSSFSKNHLPIEIDFDNIKPLIIDYLVDYYGEKERVRITTNIDNCVVLFNYNIDEYRNEVEHYLNEYKVEILKRLGVRIFVGDFEEYIHTTNGKEYFDNLEKFQPALLNKKYLDAKRELDRLDAELKELDFFVAKQEKRYAYKFLDNIREYLSDAALKQLEEIEDDFEMEWALENIVGYGLLFTEELGSPGSVESLKENDLKKYNLTQEAVDFIRNERIRCAYELTMNGYSYINSTAYNIQKLQAAGIKDDDIYESLFYYKTGNQHMGNSNLEPEKTFIVVNPLYEHRESRDFDLIHELVHVAEYFPKSKKVGFARCDNNDPDSVNEVLTEHTTCTICDKMYKDGNLLLTKEEDYSGKSSAIYNQYMYLLEDLIHNYLPFIKKAKCHPTNIKDLTDEVGLTNFEELNFLVEEAADLEDRYLYNEEFPTLKQELIRQYKLKLDILQKIISLQIYDYTRNKRKK